MKIVYTEDKVRLGLISLQKSKPKLYKMYEDIIQRVKSLDYEGFILWLDEEFEKSNINKWIKEIEPPFYEFRIPPKDKHEVMRVDFSIEDDFNTIIILNAYVKNNEPKVTPKTNRRKK